MAAPTVASRIDRGVDKTHQVSKMQNLSFGSLTEVTDTRWNADARQFPQ